MSDDELFLTVILSCTRSELYTRDIHLEDSQRERLDLMRQRRLAGEPVQYICGFTEFMGYRMEVGAGVLVPRPETEVLADRVIHELKSQACQECVFLDIGTGSGCLSIALARALPLSRGIALDISSSALEYARRNAIHNEVSGRIDFVEQSMFNFFQGTSVCFDIIISNPPYIPTALIPGLPVDVKKEPGMALDGGADGLDFYRFIVPSALRVLKPGGLLALEFGDGQRKELENLFAITGGWDKIRIVADNAGKDRSILAHKEI